ncbi:MAG: hypothetical protein ACERLM_02805 [Acidimicrobiales bacterium]
MPELRFEADTHGELVTLVRRWLASAELEEDAATAVGVVEGSAAVTKDALQVIAASAPGSIAQSDLVKSLTDLGYKATDITKQLVIDGLGAVEEVTGGSVVRQVGKAGRNAAYEMNSTIAKQILKSVTSRS